MPGSIVAANPSVVLPFSLAVAFQKSRAYSIDENRYADNSRQASLYGATSRKRWQQTKLLLAADLAELETFFLDRLGGMEEFWFYDVYETSPAFSYDETGVAVTGRYAVRFDGAFQSVLLMARSQAQLSLIEVS